MTHHCLVTSLFSLLFSLFLSQPFSGRNINDPRPYASIGDESCAVDESSSDSNKRQNVEDKSAILSSALPSSSSSFSSSSPVRDRLYDDVIHSVMRYLTLQQLSTSVHFNHQWYDASSHPRLRPRNDYIDVAECDGRLASLASSPLRRHVSSLHCYGSHCDGFRSSISIQALRTIQHSLGHISSLVIDIEGIIYAPPRQIFPSSLTELDIGITDMYVGPLLKSDAARVPFWDGVRYVIDRVGDLNTLTSLKLQISPALSIFHSGDSLSPVPLNVIEPLKRLTNLRSLHYYPHGRWTDHHMDVFRSLPSLTKLHACADDWEADRLRHLTADGSSLPQRLTEIDIKDTRIAGDIASLFIRLSSLTHFKSNWITDGLDPSFLSSFAHLTAADIRCYCEYVELDLYLAAISSLEMLIDLAMAHPRLASYHLSSLLPSLPQLTHFHLGRTPRVRSLSWTSSLPSTITKLRLYGCGPMSPVRLVAFAPLPSLTSLSFLHCFAPELGQFTIDSSTPTLQAYRTMMQSRVPMLKEFEHTEEGTEEETEAEQ